MGYYEENKEARLEYQKAYNEKNKVKISNYFKNYYIANYDQFQAKNEMAKTKRPYKINSKKKLENKTENITKPNNTNTNLVGFGFK